MFYSFEYKHPGESDQLWRESSQRDTLEPILFEMMEWVRVNAINGSVIEVRLVPLPNAK